MSSAVLVRRDGPDATPVTAAFEAIVESLGHTVVRRVRTERTEDNRYGVGPQTVERLADAVVETDAALVAVDDDLHPGQLADLAAALPTTTVRDRRGTITDALAAAGNAVAETRAEEWRLQVERRRLVNDGRGDADATADRVADLDRRRDRLDETHATRRADARTRATTGHDDAGARVVLTRTLGADRTGWAALGGPDPRPAEQTPLAPATPTTESVSVAVGTLALTAIPPVVADLPEWYRAAVPGAMAALERADAVVLTADSVSTAAEHGRRLRTITEAPLAVWLRNGSPETDADLVDVTDATVAEPSATALRERVTSLLPTTQLSLRLPYADDAHALVSWLHDHTHVVDVDYGDAITARVVAFPTAAATVRRRVAAVDGAVDDG